MSTKARDIRKSRQSDWERQERRKQWVVRGLWIGGALAFVTMIVYLAWKEAQPIPRTGVDVPLQPAEHIALGQPHTPYNSDPPTSGPHYATPAEAGFYEVAPLDEQLVHNLEHGYVIVWYNCTSLTADGCGGLKSQIKAVMQSAGNSLITSTPKLVAVPRPSMDALIALTTWGRLDKFDTFDRNRILNFIQVFRDHAPENSAP